MGSIGLGLLSSLFWGTGDFLGGLVSRKIGSIRSVFFIELFGLVLLVGLYPFFSEPFFGWQNFAIAFVAGAIGTLGLFVLYHAMTIGLMSVATPVSALFAAAIPVMVSAMVDGMPGPTALIGFVLAFLAVWFISQDGPEGFHIQKLSDLKFPLIAGFGFGMYFVLIHFASGSATLWPLIAGRTGGSVAIIVFMLIRGVKLKTEEPKPWLMIGGNAGFDVLGNAFFIFAGQAGRLDMATILASLYPLATVGLAGMILKEKLSFRQWGGIACAISAIVLLTLYSNKP